MFATNCSFCALDTVNSSSIIELSGVNEQIDSAIEPTEDDRAKEPDQIESTRSSFINEEESNTVQEETTIDGTMDESTFSDADETVNETREEIDPIEGQTSEEDRSELPEETQVQDTKAQQKLEPTEIPDNNHSDEGKLVICKWIIIHSL